MRTISVKPTHVAYCIFQPIGQRFSKQNHVSLLCAQLNKDRHSCLDAEKQLQALCLYLCIQMHVRVGHIDKFYSHKTSSYLIDRWMCLSLGSTACVDTYVHICPHMLFLLAVAFNKERRHD